MSVLPVGDAVSVTLERAMAGVSAQEQVIAANIANAATPNYHARRADFTSSLAAAVAAGHPEDAAVAVTEENTPVKADGNSVDVTHEQTALSQAGLTFSALVEAYNFKLTVMREALTH